jgi:hypothetical protein
LPKYSCIKKWQRKNLLFVAGFNNTFLILNIWLPSFSRHIYMGMLNPFCMKTFTTQQEVLLITGTGFTANQYCDKDPADSAKNLSENERLQEACWNGLLKEMLPEVFVLSGPEAKLYLWQMREAVHFFALEMGESPVEMDHYFSIDPYCFLEKQGLN